MRIDHNENVVDAEVVADRVIAAVRKYRASGSPLEHAACLVDAEEALALAEYPDVDALCDAADKIVRACCEAGHVDTCSIINARAGLCGEDCAWCAQATRYKTGCVTYNAIDPDEVFEAASANERAGVRRFSMVTSGRKVSDNDLPHFLAIYSELGKRTGLSLCASMGLLDRGQMHKLREVGVRRYHCNMETSERFFSKLCSSHTPADKKATIAAARAEGMEICSGGIIGMGESMRDRVEFAMELRSLGVDSVPVNILNPMKGTPLESIPLIGEEEVIRTAAMFRFVLPTQNIRFAGGRARMSEASTRRMLRGGVNGIMMGDLLTSVGNKMEQDRRMLAELGLHT